MQKKVIALAIQALIALPRRPAWWASIERIIKAQGVVFEVKKK